MAMMSTVPVSRLQGATRLDAQFYQPSYVAVRAQMERLSTGTVSLGRIASFVRKGIFDIKASSYTAEGVPFIRISNLKYGLIDDTDLVFLPPEIEASHLATSLHDGDIVLSKTAYPAASLVTFEKCNISQDIIGVRISEQWRDKIRPGFVVGFLNTRYGNALMAQWFQGNVQMHLALPDVREIPIPLMPPGLQLEVENLWREADRLFKESRDIFRKAEEMLLREAGFVSWEPQRAVAFSRNMADILKSGRFDAEHHHPRVTELRARVASYPHGTSSLMDVADISTETVDPKSLAQESFLYVELGSIYPTVGMIDWPARVHVAEAPSRARMLLRAGDVILSSVQGSLDKVALVSDDLDGAVGSTGFFVLRPRRVESAYLLVLAKSLIVREQLLAESTGTILASVPRHNLRNVVVPMIPEDIRSNIASLVKLAHAKRIQGKRRIEQAVRMIERAIDCNSKRS